MSVADIDFEGAGTQGANAEPVQNPSNTTNTVSNQDDVTHLNGGGADDITGKDGKTTTNEQTTSTETKTETDTNNPSTGELSVGDSIDVDGTIYTVAENGDLVDDKGVVFKEAKDVAEWLKSVEVADGEEEGSIDITSIQEALGVTITDENGKAIEFTNDAAGVKSYVDSVIEVRSKELQEAAINRLYSDNPLLKQFQDYVQLNGTPRGFGELPDRRGIVVEKDNEAQQVAIIRMAAKEFGNKTLNDNYLRYLRDSGGLYDEAKEQLAALAQKDEQVRKEIETRAAKAREQQKADDEAYLNQIHSTIQNRVISGYKLPESFTKTVNGQKTVITLNDFYDFVSRPVADDGKTAYMKALEAMDDQAYMHRELLDAWLVFTGGTHKDLIDMAVKEDKVRQLKIKSKEQRAIKPVRVITKPKGKTDINDLILGN